MQKEAGNDLKKQIAKGYELALYKPVPDATRDVFERLYFNALKFYKEDPEKTCEMIGVMDEHNNPETAALVVVANAMLNMDELITKN
jgi:hypothetical protein